MFVGKVWQHLRVAFEVDNAQFLNGVRAQCRYADGHILQILGTFGRRDDDFLQNGLLRRCLLRHRQRAGNDCGCQVLISSGTKLGFYRMRNSAAAWLRITLLNGFG